MDLFIFKHINSLYLNFYEYRTSRKSFLMAALLELVPLDLHQKSTVWQWTDILDLMEEIEDGLDGPFFGHPLEINSIFVAHYDCTIQFKKCLSHRSQYGFKDQHCSIGYDSK